jgi:hypothetical protein
MIALNTRALTPKVSGDKPLPNADYWPFWKIMSMGDMVRAPSWLALYTLPGVSVWLAWCSP